MKPERDAPWIARHGDLVYKLILAALVGLWIAFPPNPSQPSAASSKARLTEAIR